MSSPNCGDKVEVQLLFMAFFINILYMPVNEIEFDSMKIALSRLGKKTAALVKIAQEGDCMKPDYSKGCELLKKYTIPTMQGGKRKSRKKRGKGAMMSRRKKHMSAREPKDKYLKHARKILNAYLKNPNVPESSKVRELRILALQLEDDAKKGGRRKRKSRRRTKKKRKSKRRKTKRKRRR